MAGTGGLSQEATALRDVVDAALPNGPVVVALSGGADSAALCWAAATCRPVRAITIDHGLPASAGLVAAARSIARSLDVAHRVIEVEAASSSEAALRDVRLAALEAEADPTEVIATGHTQDDQAETVLSNVLRGAGSAGLGGIPRYRQPFVRPLLGVPRATTRAVARELGLGFHDDPDNERVDLRRNQIRNESIPALAATFNPKLVEALARLGAAAAADDSLLERRADRVPIRSRDGAVLVPAASIQTVPEPIAARVVRRALRRVAGPHAGVARDLATVLEVAGQRDRATLGGGIDVIREGPWLVFVAAEQEAPSARDLHAPETRFGSWVFTIGDTPGVGRYTTSVATTDGLVVRTPEDDDRISIGSGSKSVGRALAEAGVALRERPRWPVVSDGGRILWIPGVRSVPGARSGTVQIQARRTQ